MKGKEALPPPPHHDWSAKPGASSRLRTGKAFSVASLLFYWRFSNLHKIYHKIRTLGAGVG